jgi:hypothetical protein
LVIPDCANAGKDAAASRMERVDLNSMGLSYGFKKKLLLNLTDIHQIYSRLGLLPSKFIASKLLKYRNKPPDFKDLNYCLTYNSLKQATATCFSGFQINPKT